MKWLIVEDALRDRKGHWLEYVSTFVRGLTALGDEVAILTRQDLKGESRPWEGRERLPRGSSEGGTGWANQVNQKTGFLLVELYPPARRPTGR
jgi:hypothetical protein